MRDLLILVVHLVTTVIRLAKPGGLQAIVAESVLAKHQSSIVRLGVSQSLGPPQ
jgi:hypothetical protein